MGKPLKAKQLNLNKLSRDKVLKWQGVKVNKRIRLGHTGHFGKVDVIPVTGRIRKVEEANEDSKVPKLRERLPSESHSKFMKRLAQETHETIVHLNSSTRKVNEKRRAYLDSRKAALEDKRLQQEKLRVIHKATRTKCLDEESIAVGRDTPLCATIKAAPIPTFIRFGEQAERPPQIKLSKPMKGLKKDKQFPMRVDGGSLVNRAICEGLSNKAQIELLRNNAIKSYREVAKKKREQKGLLSI